jgi:hypothetical protein
VGSQHGRQLDGGACYLGNELLKLRVFAVDGTFYGLFLWVLIENLRCDVGGEVLDGLKDQSVWNALRILEI